MKNIILSLLLILFVTACDNKQEQVPNEKPTIKIGATLPLTGSLAYAGENMKAAMILALNDLQAEKDLKYNYQLVFEDDTYELKKALQNLNRFNDIEKVKAVMTFWGNIGTLASNFANQKQIIHMGCALSDVVGKGKYNFNHATTPKEHASTLISYYKKKGYKKIALFNAALAECMEFGEILHKMLVQNGFEVVFDMQANPSSRDFKAEILKMKQTAPDAVFVEMPSPMIEIFGKQVKELAFDAPLTNINTFPAAPNLFEGHIFLTEKEGNKDFYEHFSKNTGLYPMPCTANMYDGLRMIIEGFEKATSADGVIPNNENVIDIMLNNKDFNGVVSILDIDDEGNINSTSVIKRIINSKPVTVEE